MLYGNIQVPSKEDVGYFMWDCDQCIPYEHNEHLRGTTNDCDDFYKTW